MKNFSAYFLFLCILISCNNNEDDELICTIENTTGSKLVKSIIRAENNLSNGLTRRFVYNSAGKIDSIISSYPQGPSFIYYYDGDKLTKVERFRTGDMIVFQRDSFIYDNLDKISEKQRFLYQSSTGEFRFTTITYYFYDENDQIKTTHYFSVSNQEIQHINEFEWENENIVSQKTFDKNETLLYEKEYKYDTKENIYQNIPYYLGSSHYLSKNNMIESTFNDFTNSLGGCNPCNRTYVYNLNNYPVSVEYNPGEGEDFEYE